MSLDPHAVAQIQTRIALELLEQILRDLAHSNAKASAAGLVLTAKLMVRLHWCHECYSRHRSQKLLDWILKKAAELVLRVIEASFYQQSVAARRRWSIHDARQYDSRTQKLGGPFAKTARRGSSYFPRIPLTDRIRQAGSYNSPAPANGSGTGKPGGRIVCHSYCKQAPEGRA